MTTRSSWRLRAACAGMANERGSFDLFFEPEYEKEAKEICAGCEVRVDCLEFAMRGDGSAVPQAWDGILGGMNPAERTRAYRRWLHWSNKRERTAQAWRQWTDQSA